MYNGLKKKDLLIIARSLSVLFLTAVLGIIIAERQMNSLTHWHKTVQAFSITRWYNGTYCLCLFGRLYSINGLYIVGSFVNMNDKINFIIGGTEFAMPIKLYFDINVLLNLIQDIYQWVEHIIIGVAVRMYELARQLRPYINKLSECWRMIVDILFRYV